LQDYYFEHRYQLANAMNNASKVINEVAAEFKKEFGREYNLYEKYRLDDAEVGIVIIGSAAGTAKVVVDDLREKGIKAGLLKIRVFRPFPHAEIAKDLSKLKALAVLDRSDSCAGSAAPVYTEIASAVYTHQGGNGPKMVNYVYGLGGRDIMKDHFVAVFERLEKIKAGGPVGNMIEYINLR